MTKYHVVVAGARPAKDSSSNRYLPIPQANVDFIHAALNKLNAGDYAAIYHGAGNGIDEVVANWCVAHQVPQKQFPAYWQDWDFQTNQFVMDKYAAAKRHRQMVRAAKDAVYDATTTDHRKVDEVVVFLGFGNPNPENPSQALVTEDLKFLTESIDRLKNSPYVKDANGNHRILALPISMVPTVPATSTTTVVTNNAGQVVTVANVNPF